MIQRTLSIAITGSGGSGAVTTGTILLDAMARAGYQGFMARSAGPQIRGGESAVMLRFSTSPVNNPDDRFDALLSLDWLKVERFADEIPLDADSLLIGNLAAGDAPPILTGSGCHLEQPDLKAAARAVEGGRPNMVGLGVLARLLGLPPETLQQSLEATLGHKGAATVEVSMECIRRGSELALDGRYDLALDCVLNRQRLWNISGNEAAALGALRGGVRFVAAYPITPASDILEWLAPKLEQVGGCLLQAEDELASINMIIGGSFGGVPSLTATSGPGLSLMMESLGLAVASETPLVVVNVMRGGPSTGIPTKSEQSDLNIALYGFHGDAPHLVLAPTDTADCVLTTQWSVCLAERLQTVAIVLSDQQLGQSRVVTDAVQNAAMTCARRVAQSADDSYQRYQLNEDGVSPMAIPGLPDGMYTADGLEHNEHGTPSSFASDHAAQMNKRSAKLERFDYGDLWARVEGDGEIALISWGSSCPVTREAARRLEAGGIPVKVISMRLLMPLNHAGLNAALQGCSRVYVVEQNQSAQFFHYLLAQQAIPAHSIRYARPGPLPIRPGEIVQLVSAEAVAA
jgi:2-oxoglutarate ferredoxin oxidoreductase subunit alpha